MATGATEGRILLAAIAVGLACGVRAGTFLDRPTGLSNKVETSPHASGGDIILKLSDNEYVHVFTNTAVEYVFTTTKMLKAKWLVVGGGAAGGKGYYGGGGGGAGGMLESEASVMAADSAYTVSVGTGCKQPTDGGKGNNGADSVVAEGGLAVLRALGGGGGGGGSAAADGGSGGGAATKSNSPTGGFGTAGQGYDGGTGTDGLWGGSGGGGAGEAGGVYVELKKAESDFSGKGGNGRVSSLIGFEQ